MASWQTHALEILLKVNKLFSDHAGKFDIARERAETESLAAIFKPYGAIRHEPIRANTVPAEWIIPQDEKAGRVILYLHGGSFNAGSIASHRTLAGNVALACHARALLIDYRLAPEHPFPAGIEDVIASYEWLIAQGYRADQIVITGDSAGGTLTLNLLIHLRDQHKPMPVCAVCLSPAPDLSFPGASWKFNAKKDLMIDESKERMMMKLYLPDRDLCSPDASPFYADLHGLPPLLLQVGSYEALLSDVEDFATKAKAAGVDTTLEVWEGMQHEWQFAAKVLPEGMRAIKRIGEFVESKFAK